MWSKNSKERTSCARSYIDPLSLVFYLDLRIRLDLFLATKSGDGGENLIRRHVPIPVKSRTQ
jgi:hypothetical protein